MRSRPGRPRKRAQKAPGAQPTNAPVVEFQKPAGFPGGSPSFGFECYNCGHYDVMPGGRQQKLSMHNKALTHRCNQENPDSWKNRKDING